MTRNRIRAEILVIGVTILLFLIFVVVGLFITSRSARAATCDTVPINWVDSSPRVDTSQVSIDGMRMAAVGHFLWIDYDGILPDSYDPDLTTPIPDGVSSVTVCAGAELTIDFGTSRDSESVGLITPTTIPAPIVVHYGFRGAVK